MARKLDATNLQGNFPLRLIWTTSDTRHYKVSNAEVFKILHVSDFFVFVAEDQKYRVEQFRQKRQSVNLGNRHDTSEPLHKETASVGFLRVEAFPQQCDKRGKIKRRRFRHNIL